jgi:ABC-type glycerol-3-phosphate transport system substrate-binding protein
MKNVRTLLAAAVLAAAAACSGDATAPEAVQHPSRPSLENAASDTSTVEMPPPEPGIQGEGETQPARGGLIGSSG